MIQKPISIEEELNKKSEEISILNQKLQSLKTNFMESSKNLEFHASLKQRSNDNNRIKHYSLDHDFLKTNKLHQQKHESTKKGAAPIEQEVFYNKEKLETQNANENEFEKINKILAENSSQQAEQIRILTQKLEFLSHEFEKSLQEKTEILQEQMNLLKDNSSFIKENQFLHNENKKLLLEIESLNIALQKDKKEKETFQKEILIKGQEAENVKKELKVLFEKSSKIAIGYDKIKTENENVLNNKMKIIESLTDELTKCNEVINDFRQKYQNLLDNNKMIEQDNSFLKNKNEELEANLKSFQEKFVFELEKKDISMGSLLGEIKSKNKQIMEIEFLTNNLNSESSLKEIKQKELGNHNIDLRKEIDRLISENILIKKQCDSFKNENRKISQNFEEYQNKISDYEKEKEDKVFSYTLQRNKILAEYKELADKCEELEMELKNYKLDPESNHLPNINSKLGEIHANIDAKIIEEKKKGECVIQ